MTDGRQAALFGAVSLLLAQVVNDVLSRLPQIIRAWRQVRHEWSGGHDPLLGIPQPAPTTQVPA
jgi:hypothetical protein